MKNFFKINKAVHRQEASSLPGVILLSVFILFLLTKITYADNLPLDKQLKRKSIGPYMQYMEDPQGKLTIDDIKGMKSSEKWITPSEDNPGFGFTESVYWVRFTIENKTDFDIEFYMDQEYPLIDDLRLYIPEGESYKEIISGDRLPFSERLYEHRSFVFPLVSRGQSADTYFVRYKTSSSMNIVLRVWSEQSFRKKETLEYNLLMLYYGIILVMILYNLIVYIFIRSREYLYYGLFILFYILFMMAISGTGYQFIWPNSPWWENFCMPLLLSVLMIFAILFAVEFLELKTSSAFIYKGTRILLVVNMLVLLLSLFLPYRFAMLISSAYTGIVVTMATIMGIHFIVKRHRPAYFYTTAWGTLFLGAFLFVLKTFGLLPTNFVTEWSVQIGSILMVVIFSTALTDRINVMKNELLLLNLTLEDKVRARTDELQRANDELKETQRIAQLDMLMAANVQSTMFPKSAPQTPEWDIAFIFRPMSGVSGDFYDFYDKDNKLQGLSLFDVSGHGIASGLITMIARYIFYRNFKRGRNEDLNKILERANRELITEIGKVDNYLTGILLRFEDNIIDYVNAGHSDIVFKRGATGNVGVINLKDRDFKGLFIGADGMDTGYETLRFQVEKNDMLLLYTDCLYESKNKAEEEYGLERLKESLKRAKGDNSQQVLEHILNEFYTFIGDFTLKDDLTVIVMKKLV